MSANFEYEEEEARRERRREIRRVWGQQLPVIQEAIENGCGELEVGERGLTNLELQNRCFIERGKRRLYPVRSTIRRLTILHNLTFEEASSLVSETIRNMRRETIQVEARGGEIIRQHTHPEMIDVFAMLVVRYYLVDAVEGSITEIEGAPREDDELEEGQESRPQRVWEYQRLDKEAVQRLVNSRDGRIAGHITNTQVDLQDLEELRGIDAETAIERTTEATSNYAYFIEQPSQDALRGFNIPGQNRNGRRAP